MEVLVATIILKDNKILMVKETKKDAEGLLNFPAGHLEKDENLIKGALREIKEETGFEAQITSLIDTKYFSRKDKTYLAFVFQGELVNDKTTNNELNFDFYDIEFIRNNPDLLRNDKLIIPALDCINLGNKEVLDILQR